uniref:glucan 1,3-beta-glucosidase n=1 Tax=Calcidiscus leptoporus TaxID=127549 RepID=A0A7S0P5Q7_9EUKA|mmetsp:Transcript_692/g.1585  ORF Transcript_692/g.1585 Transcript_692/m.1585 type:complete len:545 (+) Transcript_692:45-1679(+)
MMRALGILIGIAAGSTVLSVLAELASMIGSQSSPFYFSGATLSKRASALRGVNLGGWLVLEPYITPSLFYAFMYDAPPVIDERSLCARLGAFRAREVLDHFRERWVTESTFRDIRDAGLNVVRVPFGFWVFGDVPGFCEGVPSIEHLDRAVDYADRYGLQLVLDLHSAPPTQNGMDHSGTSTRMAGDMHRPPLAQQLGRRPFDGAAWLRDENVAVVHSVLQRIGARYGSRRSVVRVGMINEPMLMNRDWCGRNCPIDIAALVRFYEHAWAVLQRVLPERVRPVLDIGLGGNARVWRAARLPVSLRNGLIDIHVYQAWNFDGMRVPQVTHLRNVGCQTAATIDEVNGATSLRVVVGEWSLARTECIMWLNGVGFTPTRPATCSRVRCPQEYGQLREGVAVPGGPDADGLCPVGLLPEQGAPPGPFAPNEFYSLLADFSMASAEGSVGASGWLFWNFRNEVGDPRWSFFDARARGWFPANLSVGAYLPRAPDCAVGDVLGLTISTLDSVSEIFMRIALICAALASIFCCVVRPKAIRSAQKSLMLG